MKKRNAIFVTLAVLGVLVGSVAFVVNRIYQNLYGPRGLFGHVEAARRLLERPENYKPAAVAMARLMNTDPAQLKVDQSAVVPNWTPIEIGRLGPVELGIEFKLATMSTTGGLDEFTGYRVERDLARSTDSEDGFSLTVDFGLPQPAATYSFSIPKGQGYTEEELVRGGLSELDRRRSARAAGTDPAIYDMGDPVADRERLLKQHPQIAKRLGFAVPETPSSQPATEP